VLFQNIYFQKPALIFRLICCSHDILIIKMTVYLYKPNCTFVYPEWVKHHNGEIVQFLMLTRYIHPSSFKSTALK